MSLTLRPNDRRSSSTNVDEHQLCRQTSKAQNQKSVVESPFGEIPDDYEGLAQQQDDEMGNAGPSEEVPPKKRENEVVQRVGAFADGSKKTAKEDH